MLDLVGWLYYLYQWCMVKQISDNEIYLLIKFIKSILWRVVKCLSYIEDAQYLKVKLILRVKCSYAKNMQPQYEISVLLLGHLSWHLMMALRAQYEAWKPVTSQDLRFLGWKFWRLAVNIFELKLKYNVTMWKPCMFVQWLVFLYINLYFIAVVLRRWDSILNVY